jgi:hypothetical protein
MKIPVFVSCPTTLSARQEASRLIIARQLDDLKLEWRALGRTDYPARLPLREVLSMARRCAGGIILGFEQMRVTAGTKKRGSSAVKQVVETIMLPTPWNHIEAGILFSLGLPILIFKEPNIEGGIFDLGVTDVFIHKMPLPDMDRSAREQLSEVFRKWYSMVHAHYYSEET